MQAYSFGLNLVRGGTPAAGEIFQREIQAFVERNPTATVQDCSMTAAMFPHSPNNLTRARRHTIRCNILRAVNGSREGSARS